MIKKLRIRELLIPHHSLVQQNKILNSPILDKYNMLILIYPFVESIEEPLFLLWDGHIGVVEKDSIVGFAQGRYLTVGIDIVAFLNVLQDIVEIGRHAFGLQFVETTLGANACRGCDEDFQFCIREYGGADVATVHHDTLILTHLLLLGNHSRTHKGDSGNGTDVVGYLERTNLLFNALTIEIGVRTPCLRVELERDFDLWHLLFEGFGVDAVVVAEQSVAKGIESDRAIHGARVDIDVSYLPSEVLGHRAFSARTVAVDSNSDFLHNVYAMLNSNDDALTWYLP